MKETIKKFIQDSIRVKQGILQDEPLLKTIGTVAEQAIAAYRRGNKLMFAGNGGSAADAQHFAGEMVNRFCFDRPGLPALALSTDTSILTAIGNDYGYDYTFARQVEANGREGDVFIGISTSGNAANVIRALQACREKKIIAVGMTGKSGGKMGAFCDYCIKVPSVETPRIQEGHELIGHILCALIEEAIFGKKKGS